MRNLPTNIKRNYPKKRYVPTTTSNKQNNANTIIPSLYTKGLQTVIPAINKENRNVCGQIKTYIHLKNANGEEMNICQTQNVMNLVNGAKGTFLVGGNAHQNQNEKRRK